MSRVTSKLQVTIPKRIADRYGIRPGDDIDWLEAGEGVRVQPRATGQEQPDVARRLALFDAATDRERARRAGEAWRPTHERGWTRDELYERGRAG
jgi:AbrB family looped-hinge helix DNA binding protein